MSKTKDKIKQNKKYDRLISEFNYDIENEMIKNKTYQPHLRNLK